MLLIYSVTSLASHLLVLLAPGVVPSHLMAMLPTLFIAAAGLALRRSDCRYVAIAACIVISGLASASMAVHDGLAERLDPGLRGQKVWLQGLVASPPRHAGDSLVFLLEDGIAIEESGLRLPRRIQVSWYRSARVPAPGETWRLHLLLKPARGALNPAGRDFDGWFFREGIGARATVTGGGAERVSDLPPGLPLLRMRVRLAEMVREQLDAHAMSGIVIGLAVGMRNQITASQWQMLATTGTGHLVAISGLHVGLVAGLVFVGARFAWGYSSLLSSKLAPVDAARPIALMAAAAYALLAGFALPTQRALLMLALWFGAGALRRPMSGAQVLSLGIVVFAFADPLGLLSTGFWLSFGAVATLLFVARNRAWGRLRNQAATQLKVFAGIAPAGLAAFNQVSLIAPIANMFMIPLFGAVVIPLVLVSCLILLVWPYAGGLMLVACAEILSAFWPFLEFLDAARWLQISNALEPWLVASLAAAGWMLLLPGWPGKRILLATLFMAVLAARRGAPPPGGLEVTVLDVGHAMSVVVRTHKHALVYDLGSGKGEQSDFKKILLPFLRSTGSEKPDILVLSHDDARHMGDAAAFLRRFPGAAVVTGAPSAATRRLGSGRVSPCTAGSSWQWDGVAFAFIYPARKILWEDDDSSCVLLVRSRALSILLTGDLSARGERLLLAANPGLHADVVIGLAHGRGVSSSAALTRALRARVAVVSTRSDNPWGLPARSVRNRWLAHGTALLNTGETGAVSIHAAEGWQYRWERQGRIWHRR